MLTPSWMIGGPRPLLGIGEFACALGIPRDVAEPPSGVEQPVVFAIALRVSRVPIAEVRFARGNIHRSPPTTQSLHKRDHLIALAPWTSPVVKQAE